MMNLKRFTQLVALPLCAVLFFTGCSDDEKSKPKKFQEETTNQQELTPNHIRLVSPDGSPLVRARYLIGTAMDAPFVGNFGETDENGEFEIPAAWVNPEMLTVEAPGFLRATYMAHEPKSVRLLLTPRFIAVAELRGRTTGHPVRNKDNIVDFSLVMSAMSRQDLLNFQLQKVISPLSDRITVVGQDADIPSNISLPRQTEKKLFFDVVFDKPQYRLQVNRLGPQRFFVARGRFPFSDVVDGILEKKNIVDLINFFTITGGSLRDVNVINGVNALDVPVLDLNFTAKRTYKAPKLTANQSLIALAASDNGGYMIPTDFKRTNSQQVLKLGVWETHPVYLAQVLKNTTEFDIEKPGVDRLSAILSDFSETPPQDFLPLIANPQVKANLRFVFPQIASTTVQPLTTYAVLSDVSTSSSNGLVQKNLSQVWEVFAPGWVREIQLPKWGWEKTSQLTRLEVSFIGSREPVDLPLGPIMLEKASHVTRSSVDY